MSKNTKKKIERQEPTLAERLFAQGHELPVTRRQFVGMGLAQATAFVMAPSVIGMMASRKAFAIDCPVEAPGAPLCITIDMAGGASMNREFVACGQDGAPIADHSQQGLGQYNPGNGQFSLGATLDTRLKLPMASNSNFLAGLVSQYGDPTFANVSAAKTYIANGDDTGANPHNGLIALPSFSLVGKQFITPLGTTDDLTGGNSTGPSAVLNSAYKAARINNEGSAGSAAALAGGLPDRAQRNLASLARSLSDSQMAKMAGGMSFVDEIKYLFGCAAQKNQATIETPPSFLWLTGTTPSANDLALRQVFAATGNLNANRVNQLGTIAKLVTEGFAVGATIQQGNCDVHDGTPNSQASAMRQVGEIVGKFLEIARRNGKDINIFIITDGSASTSANTENFTNDAGQFGARVAIYGRAGSSGVVRKTQFGYANPAGGRSIADISLSTAEKAAYASLIPALAGDAAASLKLANVGGFSADEMSRLNPFV